MKFYLIHNQDSSFLPMTCQQATLNVWEEVDINQYTASLSNKVLPQKNVHWTKQCSLTNVINLLFGANWSYYGPISSWMGHQPQFK